MTTRVAHVNDRELGAIYIGRPSKWGNPFHLPLGASARERDECIQRYRDWLSTQPRLVTEARVRLHGKTLACFCSPKACHGDVLAAVVDGEEP